MRPQIARAAWLFAAAATTLHSRAGAKRWNPFHLKRNAVTFRQSLSNNIISTMDGKEYSLDGTLAPQVQFFSPKFYVPSNDGTKVIDVRTNEIIAISVFRSTYEDGTTVQISTNDKGEIRHAEIHPKHNKHKTFAPATILERDLDDEFLTFPSDAMDLSFLQFGVHDGVPRGGGGGHSRQLRGRVNRNLKRGPSLAPQCTRFSVVEVAIVFDSLFCSRNGGYNGAVSLIQDIVLGASLYYENYMCLELSITKIEGYCNPSDDPFTDFNVDDPCQGHSPGATMLAEFRDWKTQHRETLGIPNDSLVHLFSGEPVRKGQAGCAYVGTVCQEGKGTGIEFMGFDEEWMQILLFTHELGHNLNMLHEEKEGDYVMQPYGNDGSDGFSEESIDRVMELIHNSTCVSQRVNAR